MPELVIRVTIFFIVILKKAIDLAEQVLSISSAKSDHLTSCRVSRSSIMPDGNSGPVAAIRSLEKGLVEQKNKEQVQKPFSIIHWQWRTAKMGNAGEAKKYYCLEQENCIPLDYTQMLWFNNNKSGTEHAQNGEYSAALVLLLEALL